MKKLGQLINLWLMLPISILSYEYRNLPSPKEIIQSFGDVGDEYIEGYTIPKVLLKTGPGHTCRKSKQLRQLFQHNEQISGYKILFFDDAQIRKTFTTYFPDQYVQAYDAIAPMTLKSDIWRLAILYLCGGVYGDLTQKLLVDPKLYIDHQKDTCVLARFKLLPRDPVYGLHGTIMNAFMAIAPRQPYIKFVLDSIVESILQKTRVNGVLDITGGHIYQRYIHRYFSLPENTLFQRDGEHHYRDGEGREYTIKIALCLPRFAGTYNIFCNAQGEPIIDRQRYEPDGSGSTLLYEALFKNRSHYSSFAPKNIYRKSRKHG